MYLKFIALLVIFLTTWGAGNSQKTQSEFARDTIITRKAFPGNYYVMDGRKLNTPVMQWLMNDYPVAQTEIRLAAMSENLSIGAYAIGGLFIFGGFLVYQEDKNLGKAIYTWGGISLGTGILLHIVSGTFQKKAVKAYNEEVKAKYYENTPNVKLGFTNNGVDDDYWVLSNSAALAIAVPIPEGSFPPAVAKKG